MKVAVVTTSPAVPSPVGEAARRLLPHLAQRVDLRLFVEPDFDERADGARVAGLTPAPIAELVPEDAERVLFLLGNEGVHGFMARAIRAIGGTVLQDSWELDELAKAAFPGLAQGGLRSRYLALREGAPALNHSVVRHADSFLVYERALGERILRDRNARTPIGLVTPGDAEQTAEQIVERLKGFPGPRTNRKARLSFRLLWRSSPT